MNILEDLVARFALQTDKSGFATAQAQVASLDDKGAQASTSLVANFAKIGTAVTAIGIAAQGVVVSWVSDFAEAADSTVKFASRIGATVEQVQQLDYIAQASGLGIEEMRMSQERLGVAIGKNDKAYGETLKKIGLTTKQMANVDAGDRFALIAEKMSKVKDKTTQAEVAVELFGRSGAKLLNVFEDGAAGIEEMKARAEALGLFSERQGKDAVVYGDRLMDLQMSFTSIKNVVAAELMPALTEMFISLTNWMIENKKLIKTAFVDAFNFATKAVKVLGAALALFVAIKIGSYFIAGYKGLMLLAAAFTAAGRAAVLAQIKILAIPLAIGAAAAIIGLLWNDLIHFMRGNDSLIGRAAKKWPVFGAAIAKIGDIVRTLGSVFDSLEFGSLAKKMSDVVATGEVGWSSFIGYMTDEWHNFENFIQNSLMSGDFLDETTWDSFFGYAESEWQALKDFASANLIDPVVNYFKNAWASMTGWMSSKIKSMLEPIFAAINTIRGMDTRGNYKSAEQLGAFGKVIDVAKGMTGIGETADVKRTNQILTNVGLGGDNMGKNKAPQPITTNQVVNVTNTFNGVTDVKDLAAKTASEVKKAAADAAKLRGDVVAAGGY